MAGRVSKAIEADDPAALQALAAALKTDAWVVVDVLEARGEHGHAVAYAGLATTRRAAALLAYLEHAPNAAQLAPLRDRLTSLRAALEGARLETLLALAEGPVGDVPSVPATELLYAKGQALQWTGAFKESIPFFLRSADMAKGLGWLAQASAALYQVARGHEKAEDFAAVLDVSERRLELETTLDSAMGRGRAHYFLFVAAASLGNEKLALEHLRPAKALAEDAGDAEYVAKALASEASRAYWHKEVAQAYSLFRRAAEALKDFESQEFEPRFWSDKRRVAKSRVDMLQNCASMAGALGLEAEQLEHMRAAEIEAEATGNRSLVTQVSAFLAVLESTLAVNAGRDLSALPHLQRAVRLYQRLGAHGAHADALVRLGQAYLRLDRPTRAQALQEEALAVLRKTPAARPLCEALLGLAAIYQRLGRSDDALRHLQEALALARLLRDAALQSDVLGALGLRAKHLGRFSEALALLQSALERLAALGPRAHKGRLLMRLSEVWAAMGDVGRALDLVDEAIAALEGEGKRRLLLEARRLRAALQVRAGVLEEASKTLIEVLAAEVAGGRRLNLATTYEALAAVRFAQARAAQSRDAQASVVQARFAEAAEFGRRALELYLLTEYTSRTILARAQLGRSLLWAGQTRRALTELNFAYESAEQAGRTQDMAHCLMGLAEASLKAQDFQTAMKQAGQGMELAQDYALDLAEGESAQARVVFAPLHRIGALAALKARDTRMLYRFLDRGRASALLAGLGGREAVREVGDSPKLRALRRAEEESRDEDARITALRSASKQVGFKEARRLRQDADAARKKLRDAVSEIRRATRSQADLAYPEVASVEEVAARLRPEDALITYGQVGFEMVAVVLTKTKMRHVKLGRADKIRETVHALLDDEENYVASKLERPARKLLLDPLELGASIERVLISPTGTLAYVPFGLLEQKREVAMLPSATVYAALRTMPRDRGQKVLALGDPAYARALPGRSPPAGRSRGGASRGGRVLTRLEATAKEVEIIGARDPAFVFVREEASETRFREVLGAQKGWRAVHLACHGFVDPDYPRYSSIALAGDKHNDGSLEALDIFGLEVLADLVVLSACNTARGRVIEGEGLEGLTRAFMFAGAPRVLASLWKVDDKATQALMTKFYELWNPAPVKATKTTKAQKPAEVKRLGAAAALREAQAFVRAQPKWSHPDYWAAWVLWGLPD